MNIPCFRQIKSVLRHPYYFTRRVMAKSRIVPLSIPFMVVTLGQACTYKCVNCCNLAPHAPAEFMRYDVGDIIGWLEHVFANVDEVRSLQLEGGEAFLHPELGRLVKFIASSSKVRSVQIATNGSVIPSDSLLDIIKNCNVIVRVSNYEATPEKRAKLLEVLAEKGIDHPLYRFVGSQNLWYDQGGKDFLPENSEQVVKKRFDWCLFRGCFSLERGQFAKCGRATNAPYIQGFASKKGDYLVLADYPGNKLRNAIIDYYYGLNYMEACRYCWGTDSNRRIRAGLQPNDVTHN